MVIAKLCDQEEFPMQAQRREPATARLIPFALATMAPATVLLSLPEDPRTLVATLTQDGLPVGTRLDAGAGLPGVCLQSGRPASGDDGMVCVPFRTPESVRGVLMGHGHESDVAAVADAVAEHLGASSRQDGRTLAGVAALASLLDLRDGFAEQDRSEVGRLATAVAERLGMGGDESAALAVAARLHEIGKIGVPDRILHKPGPLDAAERAVMERHAVWGATALRRMPGLEAAAHLVHSHHERWDGRGYPAGLVGEEIPLGSRVIGVCEAYRAMRSDRPYRGALSARRSRELLQQAAGTHFDPAVVAALMAILRGRKAGAPSARGVPCAPVPRTGERHALAAAIDRMERLPALAVSRDRVLTLLRSEPHPLARIVEVVESDVALVVAVLRAAGRASDGREITSIREAIDVLPPGELEVLLSGLRVRDFFQSGAGWALPSEPFRVHALAVARAIERVAREVEHPDVDKLVAAALLHDVGQLVLAYAYRGYPDEIHRDAGTPDGRVRAEQRALGVDHAVIGSVLLRRWGLSSDLARIVEHHHTDDATGDGALLRLADMLGHCGQGHPVDLPALRDAGRRVGLDGAALRNVLYDVPSAGPAQRRRAEPCPLSEKQLEPLRRLAEGKVYKEIAAELGLATSTVRSHLHNIYGKLGANDRAQAVLIAAEQGWL
jgi:putative nucleotidyltransferase with HDIG domain